MEWVIGAVTGGLALVLLWGLLRPRSLWRALVGWSVSDVHRHEPGGGSYTVRRLLCLLGLLGLAGVWVAGSLPQWTSPPVSLPAPNAVALMWGDPAPRIIDRVITAREEPPQDAVAVPVVGYQVFEQGSDAPTYLISLNRYDRLGDPAPDRLIGADPGEGFTAWGSADLLLHVRVPLLCVPQAVVVIERAATVEVAVFAGTPDADAADPEQRAAACGEQTSVTESLLLPIRLDDPLSWRALRTLDGDDIERVRILR